MGGYQIYYLLSFKMYSLEKSNRKDKKYMVTSSDGHTIHFGQKGYSDFTKHTDLERKKRYVARHRPRENWGDPKTAGFWSKHILWNQPTLSQSVDHLVKSGKVKVKKRF